MPNSSGAAKPHVSAMLTVVAPASMTASRTSHTYDQSERVASIGENSTSRSVVSKIFTWSAMASSGRGRQTLFIHQRAQVLADLLHGIVGGLLAVAGEVRSAHFVFVQPAMGERAVLDLLQHFSHALLD